MISGVAVLAFFCLLLVYWFRYTCLLILNARPADDRSDAFFRANRLPLPNARRALGASPSPEAMDALYASLEASYAVIAGLFSHAGHFQFDAFRIETRMLVWNYRLLRAVFLLARKTGWNSVSRAALSEMAAIAVCLAGMAGRRSANLAIE